MTIANKCDEVGVEIERREKAERENAKLIQTV